MAALRPRTASASRSDPFFRAGNFCYRDCAGEPQHAPGGRRSLNSERPEAARRVEALPAELPFVARCCVAALLRCCCFRCCCALARGDSCCKGTTGLEWATRARLLSTRQVAASSPAFSFHFPAPGLPAFQPFLTCCVTSSPRAAHFPSSISHPSTHPPIHTPSLAHRALSSSSCSHASSRRRCPTPALRVLCCLVLGRPRGPGRSAANGPSRCERVKTSKDSR
jgi:hypothetical protein